jgi:uncharacterized YigZ family protein
LAKLDGTGGKAPYPIPARETRVEIRVVNSRFIATIAPACTVDDARAFVSRIKDEFADASHNVTAYLVGHGSSVIAHANDDGEPSGTAGRPALAVLRGSGLGDAAVVVTRYFGGTKLGTGGLVRAYGDAVRAALAEVPRAVRMMTQRVSLEVPYAIFERVRLLVAEHQGEIEQESFAAQVSLTARFGASRVEGFADAMQELSGGTVDVAPIGDREAAIVPLGAMGIDVPAHNGET